MQYQFLWAKEDWIWTIVVGFLYKNKVARFPFRESQPGHKDWTIHLKGKRSVCRDNDFPRATQIQNLFLPLGILILA